MWQRYAVWGLVLAAAYGLARPGSMAGHAVTAVTGQFKGVLNGGQRQ